VEKHAGQVDKSGEPYILHPIRVMLAQKTNAAKLVGLLYDIVEDTDVTLEDLIAWGLPEKVVEAVDNVSKREGESKNEYYHRVKQSELSIRVKIADHADNMDLTRIKGEPTKNDLARTAYYKEKQKMLIDFLNSRKEE